MLFAIQQKMWHNPRSFLKPAILVWYMRVTHGLLGRKAGACSLLRDWAGLGYCLSAGTAQTGLHLAKPFQTFHPGLTPLVFKNKPRRTNTHSYIFRTAWTCLLVPEHITNILTSSIQCRYTNPCYSWHMLHDSMLREEHSNKTPPEIMSLNHLKTDNSNW